MGAKPLTSRQPIVISVASKYKINSENEECKIHLEIPFKARTKKRLAGSDKNLRVKIKSDQLQACLYREKRDAQQDRWSDVSTNSASSNRSCGSGTLKFHKSVKKEIKEGQDCKSCKYSAVHTKIIKDKWLESINDILLSDSNPSELLSESNYLLQESALELMQPRKSLRINPNIQKVQNQLFKFGTLSQYERQSAVKRLVDIWRWSSFGLQTLVISITLLDKVSEAFAREINRQQLLLIGITGMYIAAKSQGDQKIIIKLILKMLETDEQLFISEESIRATDLALLQPLGLGACVSTAFSTLPYFMDLAGLRDNEKIRHQANQFMLSYIIDNSSNDMKADNLAASCLLQAAMVVWNFDEALIKNLKKRWKEKISKVIQISLSEIEEGRKQLESSLRFPNHIFEFCSINNDYMQISQYGEL